MHRFPARTRFEIRRSDAHRRTQGGAVPYDSQAAVVAHIGPLMRVGSPRISVFESACEMFVLRRHPRPQTECAVHVNPCTLLMRPSANLFGWIKRAGVHISRLDAHNGSLGKPRQFVLTHAPLAVCFNRGHALPSETCQTQCFEDLKRAPLR